VRVLVIDHFRGLKTVHVKIVVKKARALLHARRLSVVSRSFIGCVPKAVPVRAPMISSTKTESGLSLPVDTHSFIAAPVSSLSDRVSGALKKFSEVMRGADVAWFVIQEDAIAAADLRLVAENQLALRVLVAKKDENIFNVSVLPVLTDAGWAIASTVATGGVELSYEDVRIICLFMTRRRNGWEVIISDNFKQLYPFKAISKAESQDIGSVSVRVVNSVR
jgi:hypothetical protein